MTTALPLRIPMALACIAVALALTTGSVGAWTQQFTDTAAPLSTGTTTGPAARALASLPVVRSTWIDGYDRDLFGQPWADVDRNGCDTRNDVLAGQLDASVIRSDGCTVASGILRDPYTGKTIAFTRGQRTSMDVQIDHVVALANAWGSGAARWSTAKRTRFANDRLNLLAVDGPTNMAKSDAAADSWLPRADYQCRYVARQIAVKVKWKLTVSTTERNAMATVLATCPGQKLPG